MGYAFLDFETQSAVSLSKVGAKAYLRDPTTRVMSLACLTGSSVLVWVPRGRAPKEVYDAKLSVFWPPEFERNGRGIVFSDDDGCPELLREVVDRGDVLVAHNAMGFDKPAYSRFVSHGDPEWADTMPCCRAAGLPAGLDAVNKALFGRGKSDGAAMKLLTKAKVRGTDVVYPVGTEALWVQMLRYNVADVLLLEALWAEVSSYGEADVYEADQAINARGVPIDQGYIRRLLAVWDENEAGARKEASRLTKGALSESELSSVPAVKRWLASKGLVVKSLNRQQLESMWADPEAFFGEVPDDVDIGEVVEVLKLRQAATRSTKAKLVRMLEAADSDSRVRDVHVYWGAHTGRWTGRGFQPHNLPRGVPGLGVEGLAEDLSYSRVQAESVRVDCSVDDALATLVRPAITAAAGLAIADYASVEARATAWLAGEGLMLDAFRSRSDLYCQMASRIYGEEVQKADKARRFVGKVTVLGCGYGMSSRKFAAICQLRGVDLVAAGTTPEACVDAYRDTYTAIAGVKSGDWRRGGLWRGYDAAARSAVDGREEHVGRCDFFMRDGKLVIRLPSGRELIYRNARMEDRVPGYCALLGLEPKARPTVVYDHHHGYEASLYGGLITENVAQAVCRDLLATSLVIMHQGGILVVVHVHDEIVAEGGAEVLGPMCQIMSLPPEWADGFPIGVEGFTCPRYCKEPWANSVKMEAHDGELV